MKKAIIILTIMAMTALQASGQGWVKGLGQKVKETAKQAVENKVEQKAEDAVNKTLDKTEEALKKKSGKSTETTNKEENVKEEDGVVPQKQQGTKFSSTTKYDFVPGDQILYYEDFSQDAIGDFPALWTSNGSGEVKTVNIAEGKWFHMNGNNAVYCYNKPIKFPDNFIVEFDIIPDNDYRDGIIFTLYQENPSEQKEVNDDLYPGLGGLHITLGPERWETNGYLESPDKPWLPASGVVNPVVKEKVNHVIIWIQKRRARIYHQGSKVLDCPTNVYGETKFDRLMFSGWDRSSFPYITNLKITTASPDTRSKLLTDGKIISYGIYFDSGKDVVKPESYASVKEIATVLNENPGVKIKIVGHTDSDGQDALNLDLSKRRASNVKQYLVKEFAVDGSRIETDGLGENQPISDNNTAEGKAKNRRVEFIKL
jgi:OmpA-OmpF porin, OOP family